MINVFELALLIGKILLNLENLLKTSGILLSMAEVQCFSEFTSVVADKVTCVAVD